ncbi:putative hydroxypyruvate isomerase [Pollicipes pollicipes]|uniref:putative hydroxypyruvate isomerase n=1 Tax=Pollicipes pollicipes TaxID=41117 RepID=UPI001885645D|nr:putative hydroxypyruvate isomerase [Pollicipes pollicipes]
MPLRFASNISFMFKESGDLTLRYAAAKRAGFAAVESAFPVGYSVDQIKDAQESAGVQQVLLNAHPGITCCGYTVYFLNDFQYALEVIKQVNSDHLRLQVDIFHLQNICGNISNNLKELLPYTGHVQIAQPPHRHEPGVAGELDFGYVLGLLERLGYAGWVGCEYAPSTSSERSLGWLAQLGYQL